MTTSKGYSLTAEQNAAIVALRNVQKIEEGNGFANGDLWNNIQDQIELIENEARNTYIYAESLTYEFLNGIN